MPAPTAVTGGCLCGAVTYRVDGPVKQVVGCHCTMCRRSTGHFLAFTAAWKEHMTLQGEAALSWYRSSAHSRRGFCGQCGSVLFFDTDGDAKISIAAGSLDDDTGLRLEAHSFTADKGGYYELDDRARRFPAGGDDVPMPPRE